MKHRSLALIGSIAYGVREFVATLLSFIGLRELARFVVPLLIAVLAVVSVISARDTAALLAERPEVQETTLSAVASRDEPEGSVYFAFDALIGDTHLSTPADLGTFFYLARDPEEPETGLLVRSNENDAFFRQRVVTARLIDDEAVVADAIAALPELPSGFDVEPARYVEEVAAGGDASQAFVPSELGEEPDGSEVLLAGRVVTPATHSACAVEAGCDGDDAAWFYYLADPEGGSAIVLRSPHAPNRTPVRLEGLYLRDTFDLAPVLESGWYGSLDAEVPTDRAFSAGSQPPILEEASWVPTIIFGVLALVLLLSLVVGYPVFGRSDPPSPARILEPGRGIDIQITGRLAREKGPLSLDRSPGALERLSIPDLALRMWRYGMLPGNVSRREAEERYVAAAAGERDRLVIHERDQSVLVEIERDAGAVSVEVGRVYRVGRSAPAVRVQQGSTDAFLTAADTDRRDAVAGEILGEEGGRPATA